MRSIYLFGEDYAHEIILHTLLLRLAAEYGEAVSIRVISATGGHGRLMKELRAFASELQKGKARLPDLLVVARDANCQGYGPRAKEIQNILQDYAGRFACAVPDPHVERWLLIDSAAFRTVLGRGCQAPDQKCGRDRYKALLEAAVRQAGVEPLLGGVEFAEDLVRAADLNRAARADASFSKLLDDLKREFAAWAHP